MQRQPKRMHPLPVCGNGSIEGGEPCDDGNTNAGDGCNANCAIEAGYSCVGTLSSICTPDTGACGNGNVDSIETCDDGNTNDGDGCSAACEIEANQCLVSMTVESTVQQIGYVDAIQFVGDFWVVPFVTGLSSGQSANAQFHSMSVMGGNSDEVTVQFNDANLNFNLGTPGGATVDDGALSLTSDWHTIGHPDFMINGPGSFRVDVELTWSEATNITDFTFLRAPQIQCDRGTFGCNDENAFERFQFRRSDSDWRSVGSLNWLDSGRPQSGAPTTLTLSVDCGPIEFDCGNGLVENGEACDDENNTDGDGCSSACQVESTHECSGSSSVCTPLPVCGNGSIETGESCDDANMLSGDGCDNECRIEAGFQCDNAAPSHCSEHENSTNSEYAGWQNAMPTSNPPGTAQGSYAYDPISQTVIHFGGISSSQNSSNETWQWNGVAWAEVQIDEENRPPKRRNAGLAYDSTSGRLILFGGHQLDVGDGYQGTYLSDTWSWTGTSWEMVNTTQSPPDRHVSMVRAPNGGVMLTRGHCAKDQRCFRNDTWQFKNGEWSEIEDPEILPDNMTGLRPIYHEGLNEAWFFSNDGHTIWTFNGTQWAEKTVSGLTGLYHEFVFDPRTNSVLAAGSLFEGNAQNETWSLNENSWVELNLMHPHQHVFTASWFTIRLVIRSLHLVVETATRSVRTLIKPGA